MDYAAILSVRVYFLICLFRTQVLKFLPLVSASAPTLDVKICVLPMRVCSVVSGVGNFCAHRLRQLTLKVMSVVYKCRLLNKKR